MPRLKWGILLMYYPRLGLVLIMVLSLFIRCSEPPSPPPAPELPPAPVLTSFSSQTQSRIETYFDSLSKWQGFNGVALCFSNDSMLQLSRGYRSFERNDTLQVNDAFQLASVSKPFTAYAILKLIDQGVIHPDNLVSQYLEEFPYPDVTVRMLLNHTSGLGNYTYVTDSLWGMPDSMMTNDDLLREFIAGHVPVYYAPGRQYDYCNSNYFLLAAIIDCVAGEDFRSFMQREVFDLLAMDSASIVNPLVKSCLDYSVQGHYPNGKNKLPFYLNAVSGDKGVYASTNDLFQLYKEWKAPKHLSEETLNESLKNAVPSDNGQYYALGWRLMPQEGGDTLVFHNGWWRGFRTYFWWSRHEDRCFIGLTNAVRGRYLSGKEILSLY